MASANQPASNQSAASGHSARILSIAVVITLCCLAALIVFCMIGFLSGHVFGEEFSPDSFQRRHFSYQQLWWPKVQIRPLTHINNTGDLENHLIKNKFITKTRAKKPRWDLVHSSRVNARSSLCDARILVGYLDSYDENGNQTWLVWTEEHSDIAKILWPFVAQVARAELYFLVPDLFRLASEAEDPVRLNQKIKANLNEQFRILAVSEQKLGNHDVAIKHFTQSLSFNARDGKSLRGRATSYDKLGEKEKAKADLNKLKEL